MKKYVLTEEQLQVLLESHCELGALENAGVDNWQWYGESLKDFLEEENASGIPDVAVKNMALYKTLEEENNSTTLNYYLEKKCDEKDIFNMVNKKVGLNEYVKELFKSDLIFSINYCIEFVYDNPGAGIDNIFGKDVPKLIPIMTIRTGKNYCVSVSEKFNLEITLKENINILFKKFQRGVNSITVK